MKVPLSLVDKSNNKIVQSGAIVVLTKVIINCPDELLFEKLEIITDKLQAIFRMKIFQAHQALLECLISIIFHVQDEFRHYYHKFLPLFIEQIQKAKDDVTKRVAIDAVYSIGAHLSTEILDYKEDILNILDKCRTDKNQPIRAAAQETIKLLKDLEHQRSRSYDGSDLDANL